MAHLCIFNLAYLPPRRTFACRGEKYEHSMVLGLYILLHFSISCLAVAFSERMLAQLQAQLQACSWASLNSKESSVQP